MLTHDWVLHREKVYCRKCKLEASKAPTLCEPRLTRRTFLLGALALGASALLPKIAPAKPSFLSGPYDQLLELTTMRSNTFRTYPAGSLLYLDMDGKIATLNPLSLAKLLEGVESYPERKGW